MKKLAVLVGFLVAAGSVSAGYKAYRRPVTIYKYSDGGGYITGVLSDARAAADTSSYIECFMYAYPGYRAASCYANDATWTFGSCWTSDPALLAAIDTITTDTSISFGWNGQDGTCSSVYSSITSITAPKQP